jgi:hypothetical protein
MPLIRVILFVVRVHFLLSQNPSLGDPNCQPALVRHPGLARKYSWRLKPSEGPNWFCWLLFSGGVRSRLWGEDTRVGEHLSAHLWGQNRLSVALILFFSIKNTERVGV